MKDSLMLNSYFLLKSLSQRDEKAFGLDKSDVVVEYIPLVYNKMQHFELNRVTN
jgi:KUP system potassium uptake protein